MPVRQCTIRYGTSLTPMFAKMIDVVAPSSSDFESCKLISEQRVSEPIENAKLRRPSISAILGSVDDKKALFLWQKQMIEEMGLAGFRAEMTHRMTQGTTTHSRIEAMVMKRSQDGYNEKYLIELVDSEKDRTVSRFMRSAIPFIHEMENSKNAILEKPVRHPLLAYQGRFDAVVSYKGDWHILDWKTAQTRSSLSQKGEESLSFTSYARQLAAYASAFNHDMRYQNLPVIRKGLLVSLKEDGSQAELFQILEDDMEKHFNDIKMRLQKFWEAIGSSKGKTIDFAYKES